VSKLADQIEGGRVVSIPDYCLLCWITSKKTPAIFTDFTGVSTALAKCQKILLRGLSV